MTDVWSQLDTTSAAPPSVPTAVQADVWASLDHPSIPAASKPQAEDPDVAQFKRLQGRNPTQDELASIRAGNQGNPIGAVANAFIGKPIQSAVAGLRGIADLSTGKGVEQAAKDVDKANSSPEMTGGWARATNEALQSPYNPLNYVDEAGVWLGDKAADVGAPPLVSTALRVAPDAAVSALGFRKGGAESPQTSVEPEAVNRGAHPLAAAAQAEADRITAVKARGGDLGLNLPESGTPQQFADASRANTPKANDVVRGQLGLPTEANSGIAAPITSKMLDAARARYGSPTYRVLSSEPEFELNDSYKESIGNVDTDLIPEKYRPPTDGTIDGSRVVELSRYLRNRANKYYAAAKGNPQLEDIADAHWDAAEAVENAMRDHLSETGRENLAQNWDNARTYIAQTYSVQRALDGAGNVRVSDLKQQLMKDKPLSGDLGVLAELGARYPEAFRTIRETSPQPGMLRRAAAAVTPTLATSGGALAGSVLGPVGTVGGAALGRAGGERLSEKILSGGQ